MSKSTEDFLSRYNEVDNVLKIIDSIAESDKGYMFSINGNWGTGKSFFLDLLEEYLPFDYKVIRYNCWENDYYKEPLEAILIVLAENINRLLDSNHENVGRQMYKNLFNVAKYFSYAITENKTGIKIDEVINTIFKDTIIYNDSMSLVSNLLKVISEYLDELTKENKIIIMVDELDRCIPEYAIKVLERLHHIFVDKNIIVILAVDKKQLSYTVKNIFGEGTNVNDYLKKFINFQIDLSEGVLDSSSLTFLFEDYLSKFSPYEFLNEFDNFIKLILNKIPARDKKAIFEKAELIHNLSKLKNKKYSISLAAFEITLVILMSYIDLDDFFDIFDYHKEKSDNQCVEIFSDKFLKILSNATTKEDDGETVLISYKDNLYSQILLYLHILKYDNKYSNSAFYISPNYIAESYNEIKPIVTKIYEIAQIIK